MVPPANRRALGRSARAGQRREREHMDGQDAYNKCARCARKEDASRAARTTTWRPAATTNVHRTSTHARRLAPNLDVTEVEFVTDVGVLVREGSSSYPRLQRPRSAFKFILSCRSSSFHLSLPTLGQYHCMGMGVGGSMPVSLGARAGGCHWQCHAGSLRAESSLRSRRPVRE